MTTPTPVRPLLYVPAPSVTPTRFGLLSVADLTPPEDAAHFQFGVEWKANARGDAVRLAAAECMTDEPARQFDEGLDFPHALAVTLYTGFTCKTVGLDEDSVQAEAEARLTAGEGAALERTIWAAATPSLTVDATDLGTVPDITAAVGALETHAYRAFAGRGILHAPRALGAVAAGAQLTVRQSNALATPLDTAWSFGDYPQPNRIAVSGPITVRRSGVKVHPMQWADGIDLTTNEVFVLAQRTVVVAFDPGGAVITIDSTDPTP
ncbi:hypothetical protein [Tsukamurella pseudospumae]|uniref:Uncharacterized protein n=1 Tax=Tsukamurella pseudospumae TaxID=239498 RepID=A0A137ZRU9_9ACTN|nr:hypothetical protein [Tsukamurella pseudospumae]KXP00900.1 hypothetical protein AXK61_12895 [Tsukamurella pseudospumae]